MRKNEKRIRMNKLKGRKEDKEQDEEKKGNENDEEYARGEKSKL